MVTMDYITGRVRALVKRYGTRDPFQLCEESGIRVRYKDLGKDIKAYFFCQSRIRNIVINQRTVDSVRRILCAHELGHGILHKELAAMRGFQELELFDSVAPAEYEANLFAAELLIEDDALLELLNDNEKSFFGVAQELSVPAELLDFKFRVLKNKGYRIESPYFSQADFLKKDLPGCFECPEC